jgi:hypothetical protein
MLDFRVVAESVGIENVNEQANVAQWLVAHHLAEWRAVGGQIGISSAGVDALEDEGREITFLSVVEIRQVEVLLTEIRRACEQSICPRRASPRWHLRSPLMSRRSS